MLNLEDLIPIYNYRIDTSGDLRRFITEVLQPVYALMWDEHLRWRDQADIDLANDNSINAQLADLGNPFSIALAQPLDRRRLLARVIVDVYRTKGTPAGLINVVRALTGLEIVRIVSPATIYAWDLGVDVIGDTAADPPAGDPTFTDFAVLGPSPGFTRYSFQIEVERVLTSDERDVLTEIVELVKPAHTHFAGFLEPIASATIDHWELDVSFLHDLGQPVVGDEAVLH